PGTGARQQYPGPQDRPLTAPRRDGSGRSVPNYLVWAILCTLLWTVGGVVAIFYSLRANRLLAAGDWDGAIRASHLARTWCWVSVAVGAVLLILLATGTITLPTYGR
ncbi:MAG: CD225/dispanin family protein, partial [Actinomycetota bacterium]|nr:CD225/dispanin family protein [Actinomycetota bacterium]